MIKYTFGEIFSSGGATLPKNPSDQAVSDANSFASFSFRSLASLNFIKHRSTSAPTLLKITKILQCLLSKSDICVLLFSGFHAGLHCGMRDKSSMFLSAVFKNLIFLCSF